LKPNHRGKASEDRASRWLQHRGYSLIASNYHCRFGEIDLVATKACLLVFCEVKQRRSDRFGTPAAQVNHRKQNRILKTARHFLMNNPRYATFQIRFDLISFGLENRWIEGAFFEEDLIPE
jgi:putative endonuclease